jgi:hypothetical protein
MKNIGTEARTKAEFIMKLAESASLRDEDAINAILAQLREAREADYFPYLYQRLVPGNFDSLTKLASDNARMRLKEATSLYARSLTTG